MYQKAEITRLIFSIFHAVFQGDISVTEFGVLFVPLLAILPAECVADVPVHN